MRSLSFAILLFLSSSLSGCMHPQIIEPYNTGFGSDEYLVIKAMDYDQLGQLCWGEQLYDEEDKIIPIRWECPSKLIFPSSKTVNKVQDLNSSTVRYAFESVSNSTKFTAAAIIDLSIATDSAYKFEAKSDNSKRFNMTTLQYAKPVANYIQTLVNAKPSINFAYVSAVLYGTAFVEILTNNKTSGGGSFAAFQIGDDYYSSAKKHFATSGPIIYQLTRLDPREVGVVVPSPPVNSSVLKEFKSILALPPATDNSQNIFSQIPDATLQDIKLKLPIKFHNLLESGM